MKVNSRPWDSQYSDWELAFAYQVRLENMAEAERIKTIHLMDIEDDSQMPGMQRDIFSPVQLNAAYL